MRDNNGHQMRLATVVRVILFVLALGLASAQPQEAKDVDLTNVSQRTQLRFPPAPTASGTDEVGVGSGFASVGIGDGAPDIRDTHAVGVYLESVKPHDINPAHPFEAEFKVLNTGMAPMEVPVSPHLSDLQPANESAAFDYLSIVLEVHVTNADPQGAQFIELGDVELYGSADHDGTILVLKPGEWIRVKANIKLRRWASEPITVQMRGEFLLRKNTYHPQPGGSSTEIVNLYPNHTSTPYIASVNLLPFDKAKP